MQFESGDLSQFDLVRLACGAFSAGGSSVQRFGEGSVKGFSGQFVSMCIGAFRYWPK